MKRLLLILLLFPLLATAQDTTDVSGQVIINADSASFDLQVPRLVVTDTLIIQDTAFVQDTTFVDSTVILRDTVTVSEETTTVVFNQHPALRNVWWQHRREPGVRYNFIDVRGQSESDEVQLTFSGAQQVLFDTTFVPDSSFKITFKTDYLDKVDLFVRGMSGGWDVRYGETLNLAVLDTLGGRQSILEVDTMAFPTIAETLEQQFSSQSTFTVSLPATVNSGEIIIINIATHSDGQFSNLPAGYTVITNDNTPLNSNGAWALVWKVADGSEGGTTVDFTPPGAAPNGSAVVLRIQDTSGNLEHSTKTVNSNASPDSPSLTASWGAKDNLWLSIVGAVDDSGNLTSAPTGYTGLVNNPSLTGNNASATTGGAHKQENTGTDDPDNFDLDQLEAWGAVTIVIEPAAAGGATVEAAMSLPYSLDMSSAAGAVAEGGISQDISYGLTEAGDASAEASLSNPITYGLSQAGDAVAEASVSMDYVLGLSTQGGLEIFATLSNAITYGLSTSSEISIEAGITLGAYTAGMSSSADALAEGHLAMDISYGLSGAAGAQAQAAASLAVQYALTATAQAVAEAGITLPYSLDITVSGQSITSEVTFSDGRTLAVKFQVRTLPADPQDRTLPSKDQDRTLPSEPND